MSRIAVMVGFLLLGIALTSVQADPKAPAPAALKAAEKALDSTLAEKIHQVLNTPEPEFKELPADPQTSLGDILNAISEFYSRKQKGANPPFHLAFELDLDAFKAEGVKDIAQYQIVKEQPLRRMVNASVAKYVRKILTRVEVPSGATFVVRNDHVEITTNKALRKRIWGNHPGPYLPLVHARFEKKPLADVLKALAEQSEHNILLDAKVGDKAKMPLTSHFSNLPLDSAVALLADMADLRTLLQDNAIYVSTRKSVETLKSELKKNEPRNRIGAGFRGIILPSTKAAELE